MSVHSYTIRCRETLSPCCDDSLRLISALLTRAAHVNLITARCSSLVHVMSTAARLTTLVEQDTRTVKVKYVVVRAFSSGANCEGINVSRILFDLTSYTVELIGQVIMNCEMIIYKGPVKFLFLHLTRRS